MTNEPAIHLDELARAIIRELQRTIPLDTLHPYKEIASRCGITEEHLLHLLEDWRKRGALRRMGAVLFHQRVGKTCNVMSAWAAADPVALERAAGILCSYQEVTHCYERPAHPDWPYNLYAMIHTETTEQCEQIARAVAAQTGITHYRLLPSTKEYKKESLRYF